jgi:hypothetical protein
MKTELKRDVYKIIENGEHLNSLDATERIINLAEDYCTDKMIEHINHIIDTYILDNISLQALQNKRSELYSIKTK